MLIYKGNVFHVCLFSTIAGGISGETCFAGFSQSEFVKNQAETKPERNQMIWAAAEEYIYITWSFGLEWLAYCTEQLLSRYIKIIPVLFY